MPPCLCASTRYLLSPSCPCDSFFLHQPTSDSLLLPRPRAASLFPFPASSPRGWFHRWSSFLHASGATVRQCNLSHRGIVRGYGSMWWDRWEAIFHPFGMPCCKKERPSDQSHYFFAAVQYVKRIKWVSQSEVVARVTVLSLRSGKRNHRDPVMPPVKRKGRMCSFNGSVAQ